VHLVALLEQELGEVGAVLAGYSRYECFFGHLNWGPFSLLSGFVFLYC
jgi:hypothetical protein